MNRTHDAHLAEAVGIALRYFPPRLLDPAYVDDFMGGDHDPESWAWFDRLADGCA